MQVGFPIITAAKPNVRGPSALNAARPDSVLAPTTNGSLMTRRRAISAGTDSSPRPPHRPTVATNAPRSPTRGVFSLVAFLANRRRRPKRGPTGANGRGAGRNQTPATRRMPTEWLMRKSPLRSGILSLLGLMFFPRAGLCGVNARRGAGPGPTTRDQPCKTKECPAWATTTWHL
jgi:hypothetical protein